MNEKGEAAHTIVKYRIYTFIWIGLLALTWLTVRISRIEIAEVRIIFPLLIASLKASLVLSFFMHLRYEKGFFKIIVLIMLIIFLVLISLVFSDVAYR